MYTLYVVLSTDKTWLYLNSQDKFVLKYQSPQIVKMLEIVMSCVFFVIFNYLLQ